MINISIYRNNQGKVYGALLKNHAKSIVCAAVSFLTQNTVNSLEKFTDANIICDYCKDGGYLKFFLPDVEKGLIDSKIELILDCYILGIDSICSEYKDDIYVCYEGGV